MNLSLYAATPSRYAGSLWHLKLALPPRTKDFSMGLRSTRALPLASINSSWPTCLYMNKNLGTPGTTSRSKTIRNASGKYSLNRFANVRFPTLGEATLIICTSYSPAKRLFNSSAQMVARAPPRLWPVTKILRFLGAPVTASLAVVTAVAVGVSSVTFFKSAAVTLVSAGVVSRFTSSVASVALVGILSASLLGALSGARSLTGAVFAVSGARSLPLAVLRVVVARVVAVLSGAPRRVSSSSSSSSPIWLIRMKREVGGKRLSACSGGTRVGVLRGGGRWGRGGGEGGLGAVGSLSLSLSLSPNVGIRSLVPKPRV
mmetsp:Transcript_30750/g.59287  ORF Transcript_30750/g.59287 Transcript_30750/m.59287 type:complete len:316 (+) Transcript_30750:431-1378(+)